MVRNDPRLPLTEHRYHSQAAPTPPAGTEHQKHPKGPKLQNIQMYGRIFLTLSTLGIIIGPFVADFNHTHIYNPRWPGHAKFHNGQTMSMGLSLGLCTLYYTYRYRLRAKEGQKTSTSSKKQENKDIVAREREEDDLFTAAIFASLYYITGLSAILYPGSLAVDVEFGKGFPQKWVFGSMLICAWMGVVDWGWEKIMGKSELYGAGSAWRHGYD